MPNVLRHLVFERYRLSGVFNRDEQKSRALALAPAIYDRQGVSVMMPLDPQGQGSWISLNQFGLSLCLLNNYQAECQMER